MSGEDNLPNSFEVGISNQNKQQVIDLLHKFGFHTGSLDRSLEESNRFTISRDALPDGVTVELISGPTSNSSSPGTRKFEIKKEGESSSLLITINSGRTNHNDSYYEVEVIASWGYATRINN